MPWPTFTPNDRHRTGAGFLLAAPEGSTVPTFTAAGGVFTNTWDPAWLQLGRTSEDGINITFGQENATYTSAQESFPFMAKVTSRSANVSFTLYDYNQFNIQTALNGGNWSVTGTGGAEIAEYTPALPGDETYTMLAWIGPNDDEVYIFYKTFSSAEVSMEMTRDDPRPLPLNMQAVMPDVEVSTRLYYHSVSGGSYANPS